MDDFSFYLMVPYYLQLITFGTLWMLPFVV